MHIGNDSSAVSYNKFEYVPKDTITSCSERNKAVKEIMHKAGGLDMCGISTMGPGDERLKGAPFLYHSVFMPRNELAQLVGYRHLNEYPRVPPQSSSTQDKGWHLKAYHFCIIKNIIGALQADVKPAGTDRIDEGFALW